jgi:Nif-specific regulatory protein
MTVLTAYHWPGNVRELENLTERLAILSDPPLITPQVLPAYLFRKVRDSAANDIGEPTVSRIEEMERDAVLEALEKNGWIQQKAAREIGLSLRQMGYRVKKFGLAPLIREGRSRCSGQPPRRP